MKIHLEYCKSCNFWSNENISVKFVRTVEKSFPVNPDIFVEKALSVVKKLHFIWWDILF